MVYPEDWMDDLLGAIGDEMRARTRPGSYERLHLLDGRRLPDAGPDNAAYAFQRASHTSARPPGGVLRTGVGQDVEVTVQTLGDETTVTLVSEGDLGPTIPEAELLFRDPGPLRVVFDRLKDFRRVLEDLAISLAEGRPPMARGAILPQGILEDLAPAQAEAVRAAMRAPLSLIWGPPGTGKTFTAARLAVCHVNAGRRVVLSAPTRRATDVLLQEVLTQLTWGHAEADGRVVRLGDLELGGLRNEWGEIVDLRRLRARRQEAVGPGETVSTETLLREARIVATTAHRVALGQVPRCDVLIADEASMIPLAIALLMIPVAERAIFTGDPRQLGPVVQARTGRAKRWLGRSVFDAHASSRNGLSGPSIRAPLMMLTHQHRMPPAICEVVSSLSYEGALKTARRAESGASHMQVLPCPVLYLNTSPALPSAGLGRENRGQAAMVTRLISRLLSHEPGVAGEIALITPYREHERALRSAAHAIGLERAAAEISTVHRFQGRERRIVIVSMPEQRGERLGWFLRATRPEQEGGRLLTVACSRATHHLLIVGDLTWLSRSAPPQGVLLRLLRLVRAHGCPLPARWTQAGLPAVKVSRPHTALGKGG